jgi:ribosome-interacting GTPase 1
MPANLSPEFKKAEERYRDATTPEERLVCLEEMLQTIPKHKGTEKMQADLKTRIARQKKELMSGAKAGARRGGDWFHVEKQGAGQAVVFGPPNSGKSALVRELTGLNTEVAAYPYTTTAPGAGMMRFENVQVQLVDTPPVAPDSPAWLFHILRTTDVLLWTIDLSDDGLLESFEQTQQQLAEARITTAEGAPGPLGLIKPGLLLGLKADAAQSADRLAILRELVGEAPVQLVSVQDGTGLDELRARTFGLLGVIRVYTKRPGKPADRTDPVILRSGSTVIDAAYHLHKDFAQGLQFARLWNDSGTDGLRVERSHVLADQDVVEFHV